MGDQEEGTVNLKGEGEEGEKKRAENKKGGARGLGPLLFFPKKAPLRTKGRPQVLEKEPHRKTRGLRSRPKQVHGHWSGQKAGVGIKRGRDRLWG
eukprot:354596-Chlamydomonas_euryale.AAC.3